MPGSLKDYKVCIRGYSNDFQDCTQGYFNNIRADLFKCSYGCILGYFKNYLVCIRGSLKQCAIISVYKDFLRTVYEDSLGTIKAL